MKKLYCLFIIVAFIGTTSCQKDCQEKANSGKICTADFTPVCGCNNKTYSNACNAEAVGITNYTQGVCK
jgi:hypothetical protein